MRIAGITNTGAGAVAAGSSRARARDAGNADGTEGQRAEAFVAPAGGIPVADEASRAAGPPAASAAAVAPLQTAVLQPALRALRAMPDDIDLERVAQLRDAIARGEVSFDASRLAGLIQRFHGGRS